MNERASKLSGSMSRGMSPDDLIAFIIEEAHHCVINDEHTKNAESALAVCTKGSGKAKGKKKNKDQSNIMCDNCHRPGHGQPNCYFKGGGKEGQGPKQRKKAKDKEETVVIVADDDKKQLFAFTCTSDNVALANMLDLPRSKLGTCINSGASHNYCPDHLKFTNYKPIQWKITTADGTLLSAIGMGDLHIELPNRSNKSKIIFKNMIHTSKIAFTLISVSRLDKAGYSVTFNKGMCTIKNPKAQTIATIPHSDGLYKIAAVKQSNINKTANAVSGKMLISKAHRKLGHISPSAIKHAVLKGLILGINMLLQNPSSAKLVLKQSQLDNHSQNSLKQGPRNLENKSTEICGVWPL